MLGMYLNNVLQRRGPTIYYPLGTSVKGCSVQIVVSPWRRHGVSLQPL